MLKSITTACFLIFYFINYSQNQDKNYVENHYLEYFKLNQETIFTHINKSKFSIHESLWFKTYIYNTKDQSPYLSTTNLHVSVYNSNGKLIEKKIYNAKDGMAFGEFSLSKNYSPGIYFLKVTTNWMKNFNDQHFSLEKFEILGESQFKNNFTAQINQHDIQLLPEGGHLIEDTNNSVGFKAVDLNGNSLIISSGKVLDSKGNVLANFKGNIFGIGKFNVFVKENESYHIEVIDDNGIIIKKDLPKAEPIGVALDINNINEKTLFIRLKTNKKTLPSLLNREHYFLIHRDGLIKKIAVKFELNKYDFTIAVPKEELFNGINILTLFNDLHQPILERLVFNKTHNLTHEVLFLGKNTLFDSTQVKLVSKIKNKIKKNISISVLPANTIADTYTNNSIIESFLLTPYIKGYIENPNYYFSSNSRQINYDLDLLLLTQGWSSYKWDNIFFKSQVAKFDFEIGFQIKGKINNFNNTKIEEILLFSDSNNLMLSSKVKNSYFSFDRLSLRDSSIISLGAKNKKGKLYKPQVYYNVYPNLVKDSINPKNIFIQELEQRRHNENLKDFVIDNSLTQLDTVLLTANKKDKKQKFMMQGGIAPKLVDIETFYTSNTRIIDVIRMNGFEVYEGSNSIRILSRRVTSIFGGAAPPSVTLDGTDISNYLDIIQYLYIWEVDELYISKIGNGNTFSGGAINIFTKKGKSGKNKSSSSFHEKVIEIGFSESKSYYSPIYNRANYEMFSKMGVLNWIPNLQSNDSDEFVFKIPNYSDSINLYIQGMCEDGSLISTIKTIKN